MHRNLQGREKNLERRPLAEKILSLNDLLHDDNRLYLWDIPISIQLVLQFTRRDNKRHIWSLYYNTVSVSSDVLKLPATKWRNLSHFWHYRFSNWDFLLFQFGRYMIWRRLLNPFSLSFDRWNQHSILLNACLLVKFCEFFCSSNIPAQQIINNKKSVY